MLWLLRAWGRLPKAKSSNWCNQRCRGSSIFLLESKRNRAGKFLQLSSIKNGNIFPGGWNDNRWTKNFGVLAEIVDPSHVNSTGMLNASLPSQEVLHVLEPPHYFHLHHQPLGCYPKCRFIGEPDNFLSSYASVISALAAVASEAALKDPATSKELQLTSRPK